MDIDPRSLPDPTPGGSEPEKPQVPEPIVQGPTVVPPVQPGDKTDSALLLDALHVEREKRRMAEEKARLLQQQLTDPTLPDDIMSDEGKILFRKLETQTSELADVKSQLAKKDLLLAHPEMADKWQEFEDFRQLPDNHGMNMNTAAKAFRIEKLLETGLPPRKGLEQPTGGDKTPPTTGMTADDVRTLRETNFKLYQKKLLAGEIKID